MANRPLKVVKDPSLHNVPPQSLEAEEAILCSILLDNSVLLEIVEILSPDDSDGNDDDGKTDIQPFPTVATPSVSEFFGTAEHIDQICQVRDDDVPTTAKNMHRIMQKALYEYDM